MALAAPNPIETASASPINVIRKYFIDPPQIVSWTGRDVTLFERRRPHFSLRPQSRQHEFHYVFVSLSIDARRWFGVESGPDFKEPRSRSTHSPYVSVIQQQESLICCYHLRRPKRPSRCGDLYLRDSPHVVVPRHWTNER